MSDSERDVIVLPSREQFTISDKENWEVYQAVLKDQAKPYFELDGPINVSPVGANTVDAQKGTLLTALWFGDFRYYPGFGGDYRDPLTDVGGWVRAIYKESGEAKVAEPLRKKFYNILKGKLTNI